MPLYSTLTGEWLDANTPMDAGYWYRNLRQTVLFEHATRGLLDEGHGLFLEMSPHPVLTVPVQATIDATDSPAITLGSLRRDEGGAERLLTSIAEAHARGAELGWKALFPGARTTVDLPTYPFQHQHYWLHADPDAGDVSAVGLGETGHPLLGAAVPLADGDGHLLTGRLSLRTHPWLADHAVAGAVLLPATAFVELATRAGDQVDCDLVEELTMEMPLVVPETGGVQLQLTVGPADASGRRTLAFHSRPEAGPDTDGAEAEPWTRHATGVLAANTASEASTASTASEAPAAFDLAQWPPRDARAVAIDGLYEEFAAADVRYGPAFQGLRSVWRRGDEVFAEVGVPDDRRDEAGRFGLHPVLLDAALQAAHLAQDPSDADGDEGGAPRLPFSWSGVALYATGAKSLRVRLTRSGSGGDTVSVLLADESGAPVARIGSLVSRTVDVSRSLAARRTRVPHLYRVNWVQPPAVAPARAERAAADSWAVLGADGTAASELCRLLGEDGVDVTAYPTLADLTAAVAEGTAPAPGVVVAADGTRADDGPATTGEAPDAAHTPVPADAPADAAHTPVPADAVHTATGDALALVQEWLAADDRLADARLIVLTRGAAAVTADEPVPGVAHAAVLGLLRSAQSEEPGRFVLADVDGDPESLRALPAAYAHGEPECAIRAGAVHVPRLGRDLGEPAPDLASAALNPQGTALVTGAPGGLGGLVARHLVAEHGIRHLLFLGRRGADAPGASELAHEIAELGAAVDVVACDAADRDALAGALARVPDAHPLTAVVHTAGVFDDGITASLTAAQLDRVLRPKVDAAVNLHALTQGADLAAFVLFSSVAGVLGGAGQGNYAAGNTFLDAYAQHLRGQGVPATSLAWGLWAERGGMAGQITADDLDRMTRSGIAPLATEQGLGLLDAALGLGVAALVPVRLDTAALRTAHGRHLPPLLSGLVHGPARRAVADLDGSDGEASALVRRLRGLPDDERERALLDHVRGQAAAVLGHTSGDDVDAERAFRDLGFDSLTAVELRNRLNEATGLRLPATLVFDYASPLALARHLKSELTGGDAPAEAVPAAAHGHTDEPIAIVAMSCRLRVPLRPRPRPPGHHVLARRRLPARGRCVRRLLLRHLTA
ncbi:hypothetical protein STRAU_6877 [Streptomyces aurantiacus JA 4570]|uniref:Uncharacterized protein n=1 Tax=Streptomyces aurantiacus JA 4570 TaxID=1286094 RepID=S3Z8P0_9ACTN|nr:hypothetical protein STRAU_6877 [Streptomyces aurantiacus JA 4570]